MIEAPAVPRPRRAGARPPSLHEVDARTRALWSAVLRVTVRDWLYGAAWIDGAPNTDVHVEAHRFLFTEEGPWALWRQEICELAGDRWAAWVRLLARQAPACRVCGGRRRPLTGPGEGV